MTAEPGPSDLALRGRLAAGDRSAAEELLARHLDPLYEFVHYRVGGDAEAAQEVVQETFVAALQGIEGFDGRSSLHTWMCGIAKNKIRASRRRLRPRSLEDALAAADPEIDRILADLERAPLPDEVLEREETRELVGATLSSLPPDYRGALLAKYVEGLSVAAIAGRTGRGEKATESLLTRARTAFARVFELLARRRGGIG